MDQTTLQKLLNKAAGDSGNAVVTDDMLSGVLTPLISELIPSATGMTLKVRNSTSVAAEPGPTSIKIDAHLCRDAENIGIIVWGLHLDMSLATHDAFYLDPVVRGRSSASRSEGGLAVVTRAMKFYDDLELERIRLTAGWGIGRYLWARCGWRFDPAFIRTLVADWFDDALSALGYNDDVDLLQHPEDFAAVREADGKCLSLDDVVAATAKVDPEVVKRVEEAVRFGVDRSEKMHVGKALMIAGPDWQGLFHRVGVERQTFDDYTAGI